MFSKAIRGALRLLGGSRENSQVEISNTIREAERIEPYGFTTKPHTGNKSLCIFINGDMGNGFHFFTEDSREKPPLEDGEVAIYYDKENYVKLGKDSTEVKRNGMSMTIDSTGKLKIENDAGDLLSILSQLITEMANHQTPTMFGHTLSTSVTNFNLILNKFKTILS